MTIPDAQALIDGFTVALLKEVPQDRVAAFRDLMQKGLRLGVAIDQPSSEHKPFDITSAAIDYGTAVLGNMRQ